VLAWLLWLVARRERPRFNDPLFVASVVLALSALPSVFMSVNRTVPSPIGSRTGSS
jgi:hypothetical protein